ncbi:MAG: hypothetical protein ACXWAT_16540 [Methylobacter sp.]
MSPSLFVFIALPCEARPLIQHWHLKKDIRKHPFAIYADDERLVVITGLGKIAMAGALGYTLSMFPDIHLPVLLNLGIAGHRRHELGSLYLADKIVDAETGKKFYPQLPFSLSCQTCSVSTQTRPDSNYTENFLYDMEASAFYEMAVKFSSSELIHCLKIVSDNLQSSLENINEPLVEDWCVQQLPTIDQLATRLERLRQTFPIATSELHEQLLGEFHFTATSAAKLKALLNRWHLLKGAEIPAWRDANPRSGKEVIAWMEKQLETTEFYL